MYKNYIQDNGGKGKFESITINSTKMCFHSKQTKDAQTLENRFKAKFKDKNVTLAKEYNGFQYPQTPVITNTAPELIQMYSWGLIPHWAKDESIRANTLNAKMETISEKPSFRDVIHNRCLILADGFYEWQWLDSKGKNKQKYEISLPEHQAFAFAGLWSQWTNPTTKELHFSYSILTTEANELMSTIHNSKKRMPLIVAKEYEQNWLQGETLHTQNNLLMATPILKDNQLMLF